VTVLKARKIEAALLEKGFRADDTHHRYFWLFIAGKRTSIRTFLSHGGTLDYGDDLLAKMKRQLKLSKAQLLDLVECRLTGEMYVEFLLKSGAVSP
jgi:hypothetical protein